MCKPPVPVGSAGKYPICIYPGGNCPPGLTCYLATALGGPYGYCFY